MKTKKTPRSKKIKFERMHETAYTDWVGTRDEFDCPVCNEPLEYPIKKCPDCGSTFKYRHAVMTLVEPILVKEKPYREPIRIRPFSTGYADTLGAKKPRILESFWMWWNGPSTLSGGKKCQN